MPDEPLSLSGLLKAQEERDELLGAIDQSWRPEVRALRAEVERLRAEKAHIHIHQSFVDGCYPCELIQQRDELRAENGRLKAAAVEIGAAHLAAQAEIERLKQALAQTTGVAVSLGTGTVAAQRAYEENRTALLEVSVENERLRAEADRMEILRGKEIIRLRAALEHMVDVFGPLGRMGAGGPALDEARAALGRDKDG